jgi:hypothetical protein
MEAASRIFGRRDGGRGPILNMTTDARGRHEPRWPWSVPGQRASKTAWTSLLSRPAHALGEEQFYNVDVIGEIVRKPPHRQLLYRFDVDRRGRRGKIPLTVRRCCIPSTSSSEDLGSERRGPSLEVLKMPEQPDAPPPEIAAARADGKSTVDKIRRPGCRVRGLALPIAKVVTGLRRFEVSRA